MLEYAWEFLESVETDAYTDLNTDNNFSKILLEPFSFLFWKV